MLRLRKCLMSEFSTMHFLTTGAGTYADYGCCAGPVKKVKSKSGGEAWALNQSSKDPARVTAAKQALTGKLSKSIPKKPVQAKVQHLKHPHTTHQSLYAYQQRCQQWSMTVTSNCWLHHFAVGKHSCMQFAQLQQSVVHLAFPTACPATVVSAMQ